MKQLLRWISTVALVVAALTGCATLDHKQRELIFQPSNRTWVGGAQAAEGMEEVWIEHRPKGGDKRSAAPVKLHGLWLAQAHADAPVMLYLHGSRWDVRSSAHRMRRLHALGFAVLGIDYRGFGQSTQDLPSEEGAHEDALAAWQWLAQRQPQSRRYLFGHSLGGAIAVRLASEVTDDAGLMVEGTFTSIADVVKSMRWGWLPVAPLITQRFDAASRVQHIGVPLLVVHGSQDQLIPSALGRQLFDQARNPKRFVLVEGGTHHNTNAVGHDAYKTAVAELFGVNPPPRLTASR